MIWVWLIVLLVFAGAEAATAGLISVWFVFGAAAAMLSAIASWSITAQLVVFVGVSAAALVITRPLVKKYFRGGFTPTNADRVLGQTVKVTETICNERATGAVYADGKTWTARSMEDNTILSVGTMARVEKLEGVKLFVSPVLEEALQKAEEKTEEKTQGTNETEVVL